MEIKTTVEEIISKAKQESIRTMSDAQSDPFAKANAEREERRRKEIYNRTIPVKYRGVRTDKTKTFENVLKNKLNAYCFGGVGTGKTTFVLSVAEYLIMAEGVDVEFISSPDFVMKLQTAFRDDSRDSHYEILKKISRSEVLIIDDLGAEKMTDFVKQSFYYLINEREQWGKRTLITSNFSPDDLDRIFESRVSSRICGMCDVIEFTGRDRRQDGKRVAV